MSEPEPKTSVDVRLTVDQQAGGVIKAASFDGVERINKVIVNAFAPPPASKVHVPPLGRHPFFGRIHQQQSIFAALQSFSSVLVHGTAGMGKTTLAAKVAVQLYDDGIYTGGIVWISDVGTASVAAVCDAIARQLEDERILKLPARAKPDAVRDLLASRKPMLLVLDALDDHGAARELIERAVPGEVALLATSRNIQPIYSEDVDVPPLDLEEAVQLFESRARERPGNALVKEICTLLGNYPQAIVLVAARRRAEKIALEDLRDRLRNETDRLGVIDAGAEDEARGVRASLYLSLEPLPDGPRKVFVHLASCFGDWTTLRLLAEVCGLTLNECEDHVGQLAKRSLLDRDQQKRVHLQRLVRDFGCSLPPDPETRRGHAVGIMVAYAARYQGHMDADYDLLEEELGNLLGAVRYARNTSDWPSVLALATALGHPVSGVLAVRGHWADLIMVLQAGSIAAEQTANHRDRGWFMLAAGAAVSRTGDIEEARRLYARALRIFRKLRDGSQVAKVLHNVGKLAQDQGNYRRARRAYESSLRIKAQTGDTLPVAPTLHELGRLAFHEGKYDEALAFSNHSLEIKSKARQLLGMALTTFQLARIEHVRGNYESAAAQYGRSQDLYEEVADYPGIAMVEHYRGRLAFDRGHLDEAEALYARSLAVAERLRNQQELGDIAHDGAVLALERDALDAADSLIAHSLKFKAALGDRPGCAATLLERVRLMRQRGRIEAAREALVEATAIVEEIGEQAAIVRAMYERGWLAQIAQERERAGDLFQQALDRSRSLSLRLETAQILQKLGEIAFASGNVAEARQAYVESLALFEQLNKTKAADVRARLAAL